MKRVLFLTNYPSPYRVQFYDELAKYLDVTVLFSDRIEKKQHRDAAWFVEGKGKAKFVQLEKHVASVHGRDLCTDVIDWLKKPFDAIVVCGYSAPTEMLAMAWLRMKKIPFWMEVDGGLVRKDSKIKYLYKKMLVSCASRWISSGEATNDYLAYYGADRSKMEIYPFTSLYEKDILTDIPSREEKLALRNELGLTEEKIVLSVGRVDHGKGFDVLLKAAAELDENAGLYIVGGEPDEELRQLMDELSLNRVHFIGFKRKEELLKYYQAADLFVLPTRSDVWGLVINESMACGLPVVTTNRCVAGLELIRDGVNGYIVPIDDAAILAQRMNDVLSADLQTMGRAALETIRPYTIENMAKVHSEILG